MALVGAGKLHVEAKIQALGYPTQNPVLALLLNALQLLDDGLGSVEITRRSCHGDIVSCLSFLCVQVLSPGLCSTAHVTQDWFALRGSRTRALLRPKRGTAPSLRDS